MLNPYTFLSNVNNLTSDFTKNSLTNIFPNFYSPYGEFTPALESTNPNLNSQPTNPLSVKSNENIANQGSKFSNWLGNNLDTVSKFTNGIQTSSNSTQEAARDLISTGISKIPVVGGLISAGAGLTDGLMKAAGLSMDTIDKDAREKFGLNTDLVGGIANILPGGQLLGAAFGKNTIDFNMSNKVANSSGYGGSFAGLDALSGKRVGRGQANDINAILTEKQKDADKVDETLRENEQRLAGVSSTASNLTQRNYAKLNGLHMQNTRIGKSGFKLDSLEDARMMLKTFTTPAPGVQAFQEGGKMNVIVEGALHARKHNLESVNPELAEEVTHKGVPVVMIDEDESIKQVAEVEGGELILTREITDKLEELFKNGDEESMIKAGKLIAEEIIDFTEDLTNSIINSDEN